MKIEEIKEKKENSWFALSTGYNRLLVVSATVIILVVACFVEDADQIFIVSTLTLFIELCIYFASVWIYQGFNEPTKKNEP